MVYRDTLLIFLNKYFAPYQEKAKKDLYSPNGVQIEGKDEIKKIILGVSANKELFEKAVKKNTDCIIVHHSLFLDNLNHRIDPILKERLKIILEKNITLIGYHFLLDHHPEIGNNALVIRKLGADLKENLHDEWGWVGEFKEKKDVEEILNDCKKIYDQKPFTVLKGPKKIKKFAVVSGAGAPYSTEMTNLIDNKIDLFITGESKEQIPALFQEAKINFASFGHYSTEKIGIKALGDIIKSNFYVDIEFIDIPNEL